VQVLSCLPSEEVFVSSFAPARTYGFLRDLGTMRKNGLALGGSLDNAIVVGKRGTVNGLRFKDEFVRHKVLDLIGDLALLGRPIHGHVIARNGGHALNFQLVVAIEHALRLAHRPAEAPVRVVSAERAESFAPAPGLAATL
jgi:UDP-3-O-[3-hydroxymyristoyl] N-acetylglucosamine deacetylase